MLGRNNVEFSIEECKWFDSCCHVAYSRMGEFLRLPPLFVIVIVDDSVENESEIASEFTEFSELYNVTKFQWESQIPTTACSGHFVQIVFFIH